MKGAWNDEEDEQLVALMAQDFSSWSRLAANTRRIAKQVRCWGYPWLMWLLMLIVEWGGARSCLPCF